MEEVEDVQDVPMQDDEPMEAQQPATIGGATEGGVTAGIGNYKITVADTQLPLVGIFFTAVVLLIAVSLGTKGNKFYAYGLSVAAVAMVFSFLGLLLTLRGDLNEQFGMYNSYFLCMWSFIGACILTFPGPFDETGNGYFASWGLAIFGVMSVGVTRESMKSAVTGLGSLLGLGGSAIIVLLASLDYLGGFNKNQAIFAIVVASLTIVVVGIFVYLERNARHLFFGTKFPILVLFAILWIVLACVVTFQGPFIHTGNGYFGSWGGAVTSVYAAVAAFKED